VHKIYDIIHSFMYQYCRFLSKDLIASLDGKIGRSSEDKLLSKNFNFTNSFNPIYINYKIFYFSFTHIMICIRC